MIIPERPLLRQNSRQMLFATDRTSTVADYYLRGNPVSIVGTNISSIMGGRSNPWEARKTGDMALVDSTDENIEVEKHLVASVPQDHSDGILEFAASETILEFGFDFARRLAQAGGPLELRYKDQGGDFYSFLQVDGEFFKIHNPEIIKI